MLGAGTTKGKMSSLEFFSRKISLGCGQAQGLVWGPPAREGVDGALSSLGGLGILAFLVLVVESVHPDPVDRSP